MDKAIIYHNPRCSKSRQALQLLKDNGIEPEVIDYLANPPTIKKITDLLALLKLEPRQLMRKNETIYKTCDLGASSLTKKELIKALADHPILIERPIVIYKNKAIIARPPERVLELL